MTVIEYDTIESMGDDHYDVGIIGVWYGENYGSTLTYHALQRVIRNMGYSVMMLEKPASARDPELDKSIHPRVFAAKHYQAIAPRLALKDLHLLNEHCTTYVVGSDQVWNYGIARGFGKSFYLDFAGDGNRKVSYATSFGHGKSNTPLEALPDVARLLHNFDAVSVREQDAVSILKNEFDVVGTQVLDPVFLLNRSEFAKIAEEAKPIRKKYVLAYILDPTPEMGAALKRFAKKENLELIVVLDARGDKKGSTENFEKNKKILGVRDAVICPDASHWMRSIADAEYVVTDSFHGASFSLIFQKQFTPIINMRRGASRLNTLVDVFGIRGALALNGRDLNRALKHPFRIDYERIEEVLLRERERSMSWLKNALECDITRAKNVARVPMKLCCGCGACYSVCPTNAVSMQPDEEGFLYPVIDGLLCINCKKCLKACPSFSPRREKWSVPSLFAGYTGDEVREISSSGGIFSLVADRTLKQGGVVFGAAFDEEFHLRHVKVNSYIDLGPLRMSKYLQSEVGDTYCEAKAALENGDPVLYVGCPCQIAGLNSYLGKDYDNLVTIDLLCHGGPSQQAFKKYLSEVHGGKEISYIGFRDKDYFGWSTEMTVKYSDGEIYREKRDVDLFYRAFLPCYSVRPFCQICSFSRLPRQGDLTLGDFWGVSRYRSEYSDGRGTSIIGVNNRKGLQIVAELQDSLEVLGGVNLQYVLEHGQPLSRPFRNGPLRTRFHRLLEFTTFEKAVDCCSRNVFDIGLIGLRAGSLFDIVEHYALYLLLAQQGASVLNVRYPADAETGPTLLQNELEHFANEAFPCVSSNRIQGEMAKLNEVCCGFVVSSVGNDVDTGFIAGKRNAVKALEVLSVNPIFFLGPHDVGRLQGDYSETNENEYIGVFFSENRTDSGAFALSDAFDASGIVDISADKSVKELIAHVNAARLLVTNDIRCFALATILKKPAVMIEPDQGARNQLNALSLSEYACADLGVFEAVCERTLNEVPLTRISKKRIDCERNSFAKSVEACMSEDARNRYAETVADIAKVDPSLRPSDLRNGKDVAKKGIGYARRHGVKKAVQKALLVAKAMKRKR